MKIGIVRFLRSRITNWKQKLWNLKPASKLTIRRSFQSNENRYHGDRSRGFWILRQDSKLKSLQDKARATFCRNYFWCCLKSFAVSCTFWPNRFPILISEIDRPVANRKEIPNKNSIRTHRSLKWRKSSSKSETSHYVKQIRSRQSDMTSLNIAINQESPFDPLFLILPKISLHQDYPIFSKTRTFIYGTIKSLFLWVYS